ncbi:MAG: hypothetical protein MZU97_25985 [Bacillus subtilis]|nr:hypothetical protein [Bacillus subtilis]
MNQAMKLELPSLNKQSIKRLSSQYDLFKINHGYELTQTVIEYMASNYGWDAIVNFVKNPEDYETVFGCDESAFWEGWLKSVQMRFARKEGVL